MSIESRRFKSTSSLFPLPSPFLSAKLKPKNGRCSEKTRSSESVDEVTTPGIAWANWSARLESI